MEYPKTTKNVGQPCVICGQLADAQATIAALQDIIKQMGGQAAVLAKDAMAAKYLRDKWQAQLDKEQGESFLRNIEFANLQAELERVKGELAETKEEVTCLVEQVSALNQGCLEYERLIKALPKVEGEIEVSSGVYNFILLKHDSGTRFLCGQIETEQTAQAIAALWEHRQGMEG